MKQKRLNRLLMLLVAFITMSINLWGAVTFNASDFSGGTSGTGSSVTKTIDGVTVSSDKGYATTQFRVYLGGKLTNSSSVGNIPSIAFTFSGSYSGGLSASYDDVNSASKDFTTTAQARITKIEVTIASAPSVAYSVTLNMDGTQYGAVLTEASVGAGVTLPSVEECGDTATGSNLFGTTTATKLHADHPITYKINASNTYSYPLRVYSDNVVTIAGGTMTRIVFTVASGYDATKLILQSGGGSISNGVWTGSSPSVQVKADGAQVRISSISVTYGETTTTYTSSPECGPATYTASVVGGLVNGSFKVNQNLRRLHLSAAD